MVVPTLIITGTCGVGKSKIAAEINDALAEAEIPNAALERLRERMAPGPSRNWHERRTVELEEVLQRAGVEDFAVTNDDRGPREVALDVLRCARWLGS